MCGIGGFAWDTTDGEARLESMCRVLRHRGPDDHGVWLNGSVGLCHTRLSIIDLTKNGHQPMLSGDGRAVVTFNGEIYNFLELRRELEEEGVRFTSRADTEVIVEGYRKWGEAIFGRLNGMFALALVNIDTGELFLSRDRFGVKPLYVFQDERGIVFGSEIKAIRAAGVGDLEINTAAIAEFLHYSSPLGPTTFYREISKLPAGTIWKIHGGSVVETRYADMVAASVCEDVPFTAAKKTLHRLSESVARQCLSDVPIAVFLSGGIDSSAIATLAARNLGHDLQTISAHFTFSGDQTELRLAKRVADAIGSEHREMIITPSDLPNAIESIVCAHDQPFGDPASIPIYLLCRELDGQVKVVLQGDGGDELFGGYPRYRRAVHAWAYRAAGHSLRPFRNLMNRKAATHRALRTFDVFTDQNRSVAVARLLSQTDSEEDPTHMLGDRLRRATNRHDPFQYYREMYSTCKNQDWAQEMMAIDLNVLLPDVYFEKVDRSAMANSIEVRVPMMDNDLVSYVGSLPRQVKMPYGKQKWLLKESLKEVLPEAVLKAKKRGFTVPVGRWFKGPLREYLYDNIFNAKVIDNGILDEQVMRRRIYLHESGNRDYSQDLYKMLNLSIWYQRYMA